MRKVGILEDHPVVATGVKQIIHSLWPDAYIEVFGHFPQVDIDLARLYTRQCIVADIHLLEQNILNELILLQMQRPQMKIILYTSSQPWELDLDIHSFPFWGYVQKTADLQDLASGIRSMEGQEKYFSSELKWERVVFPMKNSIMLTKREKEILKHLKLGKTSREIAEILYLSELTIKSHRQNMMKKFDVKNVIELIDKTNDIHS